MKRITLLSTGLILTGILTACNSTVKPDCWKATHNTIGKDCNSGSGGVSMKSPGIKGKLNKKGTTPEDIPEDTTPDDTEQQDDDSESPPNQSNSNDIPGYDPFTDGLYGPGT